MTFTITMTEEEKELAKCVLKEMKETSEEPKIIEDLWKDLKSIKFQNTVHRKIQNSHKLCNT